MQIVTLVVGPIGANCYLVWDEETMRGAVIDPGAAGEGILAQIKERGLDIRAIFLTHGHYDHTGGAAFLQSALPDAVVHMHPGDMGAGGQLQYSPPEGWMPYGEGDSFVIGGLTFAILHTPGHSPGSVVIRCGDCLFTGDTLFHGDIGRTDFPNGDDAAMTASLARLGRLEGNLRVLPGHEEPSALDEERAHNPYLRRAMAR